MECASGVVFSSFGLFLGLFAALCFWLAWDEARFRWRRAAPRVPEPAEVLWLAVIARGASAVLCASLALWVGYWLLGSC